MISCIVGTLKAPPSLSQGFPLLTPPPSVTLQFLVKIRVMPGLAMRLPSMFQVLLASTRRIRNATLPPSLSASLTLSVSLCLPFNAQPCSNFSAQHLPNFECPIVPRSPPFIGPFLSRFFGASPQHELDVKNSLSFEFFTG